MRSLTADARRLLDELVNDAVVEVLSHRGATYTAKAAGQAVLRLTDHLQRGRPGARDLLEALATSKMQVEINDAVKRESAPISISHDGAIVKAPGRISVRGESGYQLRLWTDVTPAQFMEFLQGQRSTRQTLESNLVVYEAIGRRVAEHMDADTVADALQREGIDPATFTLAG